jgi:hypothetical protein
MDFPFGMDCNGFAGIHRPAWIARCWTLSPLAIVSTRPFKNIGDGS